MVFRNYSHADTKLLTAREVSNGLGILIQRLSMVVKGACTRKYAASNESIPNF